MQRTVPDKPSLDGLETKWSARWDEDGTYQFDRNCAPEDVFSIDTPPPTVSGSLHIGHVYSYTHADVIARFQRMSGKAVFYPIGWDDNGVPTERRVENYYGVRCDPAVAQDPNFEPPAEPGKDRIAISRPDFVRLCHRLTTTDEKAFEDLWRQVGLSVDWRYAYTTIGENSQRASQRSFVRMLERGDVYSAEAPTLWDIDFQTAVSQAELEDREAPGAWHRVVFEGPFGPVEIQTTRPELLAACVALVAHPSDERYSELFGKEVVTPLFGVAVPVLAHELADPEKGTGIAMVCTFGDTTDVIWWRELNLPIRPVMGRDGRLTPVAWGEPGWESKDPTAAQAAYDRIVRKGSGGARLQMAEMLAECGALLEEPKPLSHSVKFYEKGRRPLEIVTSRQWFVALMDRKQELLGRGAELAWHPPFMQSRYESWVEGLASDWNLSRQRYFGVPFPIWYRIDENGEPDYDDPIVASQEQLPVDPSIGVPPGFDESQRGLPGGFVGDPDVMDTWATSSLTPQIAGGWVDDPELYDLVFPMSLRPQGQDIIRTWLFYTAVRAHLEMDTVPWSNVQISGFIVDPDRKKMSKSKGNVVTPAAMLQEHGTDAVRYWASCSRPGMDTVADAGQMKVGRRLSIKLLNASRFALNLVALNLAGSDDTSESAPVPKQLEALDAAMLARLARVVEEATTAMHAYDYARALERTESFFWSFCDDYLELVKTRAYGEDEALDEAAVSSARYSLVTALSVICRLFAPVMPFVTEEVWSWWHEGSVHLATWPKAQDLWDQVGPEAEPLVLDVASEVLGQIRRTKSEAKKSMRAPVASVRVTDSAERLAALEKCRQDILDAGVVAAMEAKQGTASVIVELA